MLTLTSLDILYITLSIFTAVVWTLLSIVLFRVIKVLWPVLEILEYYKQFKSYLSAYSQIPAMVKDKVFEIVWGIWKKTKKNNKKQKED